MGVTGELWIVNALTTEATVYPPASDDGGRTVRALMADEEIGLLGYLPVYATREAALADHPTIAAMDAVGQANHLRCVTLD